MKYSRILYLSIFACFSLAMATITSSCKGKGTELSDTAIIDDNLKKLDKDQFSAEMNKSGAVLIDLRMPQEFEQGHIEGAININFFDPEFKYKLLELDKDKSYFIYDKG